MRYPCACYSSPHYPPPRTPEQQQLVDEAADAVPQGASAAGAGTGGRFLAWVDTVLSR